jgi:hypothetical protein
MHTTTHTSGESWILMAMQQCKAILHLVSGPEIFSIGHNPYQNGKVFSNQTTLSTSRPHFLCEKLSDLETMNPEPMSLSAAIKELDRTCQSEASVVSRFSVPTEDPKMAGDAKRVVGLHHLKGLAPAQLQKVQSGVNLMLEKAGSAVLFGQASRHGDLSRHELSQHSVHSLADRSRHAAGVFGDLVFGDLSLSRQGLRQSHADRSRHAARRDQTPVTNANNHSPFRTEADATCHSNGHSSTPSLQMLVETAGPAALDRALDGVQDGYILQLFNKTATLERWHENRHASFERYVAFLVLFHQMAARVASFAPLAFNISRSQSQLRVATTAAPISAAEIQQQWGVDFHDFGENPLESMSSADRDETLTRIDNHGNPQTTTC